MNRRRKRFIKCQNNKNSIHPIYYDSCLQAISELPDIFKKSIENIVKTDQLKDVPPDEDLLWSGVCEIINSLYKTSLVFKDKFSISVQTLNILRHASGIQGLLTLDYTFNNYVLSLSNAFSIDAPKRKNQNIAYFKFTNFRPIITTKSDGIEKNLTTCLFPEIISQFTQSEKLIISNSDIDTTKDTTTPQILGFGICLKIHNILTATRKMVLKQNWPEQALNGPSLAYLCARNLLFLHLFNFLTDDKMTEIMQILFQKNIAALIKPFISENNRIIDNLIDGIYPKNYIHGSPIQNLIALGISNCYYYNRGDSYSSVILFRQ